MVTRDHGDVGDAPSAPPPLQPPTNSSRPSPAEQARTIAAANNAATLATLTSDGDPWASLVAYGLLNGAPVLCVSNLAEHGRNLAANPRASLSIVTAYAVGVASVDPDDDAVARYVVTHYRYDPDRRERRHVVVAAFDNPDEFHADIDLRAEQLRIRRARGEDIDRLERITGRTYAAAASSAA